MNHQDLQKRDSAHLVPVSGQSHPSSDPTQEEGNSEMSPVDRHVHGRLENWLKQRHYSVRHRGFVKVIIGVPLGIGWFLFQQRIEVMSEWLRMAVPGFPGVLALIGLVELTSGIPISRLSNAWDGLPGWQRGVIGILILIAFAALLFTGMYLFLVP